MYSVGNVVKVSNGKTEFTGVIIAFGKSLSTGEIFAVVRSNQNMKSIIGSNFKWYLDQGLTKECNESWKKANLEQFNNGRLFNSRLEYMSLTTKAKIALSKFKFPKQNKVCKKKKASRVGLNSI